MADLAIMIIAELRKRDAELDREDLSYVEPVDGEAIRLTMEIRRLSDLADPEDDRLALLDRLRGIVPSDGRVRSWEQAARIWDAWGHIHADQVRRERNENTRRRPRYANVQRPAHITAARWRAWHIMAGKWRKGVSAEIRQCHVCGKLLLTYQTEHRDGTRYAGATVHQACLVTAMRTDGAREWLSKRKVRRNQGESDIDINRAEGFSLPLPKAPNLPKDERTPHKHFVWAVRYLLGGEDLGAIAADETPRVSTPAVSKAIARIVDDLLPDPEQVDAKFRGLVVALREARAARSASL